MYAFLFIFMSRCAYVRASVFLGTSPSIVM